ncbi:MAG: hypothetical protein JXR73_20830 [Candidatus Omnitrophica bacterium]|nr:hypothetical protein [Candidatus Omnitrophota bacterium]
MFINSMTTSAGPGIVSLLYAASVWMIAMMIILYHRAGIQLIGTVIALVGFLAMLTDNRFFLALSLFAIGLFVHSCGRILFNLKRKP